ncbi:MAG: PAS domain-containing sensor histidine kinase [Deltaproteobacteria bacterium RBG_13_52_11]|nr:MAG: PAS domain-containing sensor histidine kinase [Deltaproteobacteria bacterium RBG_13_52_11]
MNTGIDAERRKRKRELVIIIGLALLVFGITYLMLHLPQLSNQVPVGSNILLFSIININLILLVLLSFLVIRNLVKLLFERKRRVLGTRLRTKLVAAFVSLSLVPTLLLFLTAVIFITRSVENWFNVQVESSLQGSLEVAQTYYRDLAKNTIHYSQEVSRLASWRMDRRALEALLEKKRTEYNLAWVGILSLGGKVVVESTDPSLTYLMGGLPKDSVQEVLKGKEMSKISPYLGGGEIIWGGSPFYNKKTVVGVVVAGYYVPQNLVAKMEDISQAFVDYRHSKILKKPLTTNYIIIFLLITLVIIFSATWFGFRLAKELTVPLMELAEGTRRVASGNLDFRIGVEAEDEIGTLVSAFNKMTHDLKTSKVKIEESTDALQLTNLELEQRRKYMEIVLENVAAGVISFDKKGTITTINKPAERMLDLKAEDVLGENYRKILQPEYRKIVRELIKEINTTRSENIQKQMEITLQDKVLTVLASVNILRDERGEYLGMVAVFDDLTHLIKVQRLSAWRDVARRIAHEIKNPLTPIQLSAQRIYKKYRNKIEDDAGIFEECTNTIIHQVTELKNLVNEFSNFARMPAVTPTPNDLNEIINSSLILFKEAHRDIRFDFFPDPQLPIFKVDRDQMKRVFINILDNAVAAVDGGGVIEIEIKYDPSLQMVTLEVRDNGCGVPDEDKPKLFEPYFSTKKSGTGLGLAIVNAIISDHNGYIRVRDNHPKGTKFIIDLPLRQ